MSHRSLWIAVAAVVALHGTLGLSETLLMLWVVPNFAAIFAEFGAALPTATVVVRTVADRTRAFWWALAPLGLMALALDAGLHALVGRRLGLGAYLGLGALIAGAQLLAPALGMLALYLPLFLLAQAR